MTWSYAYTLYFWPSLVTVLFLLALATYSWRRRSVPGALAFAAGSLLAAFWVGGSVMEYAAVGLPAKIFWVKFQAAWQLPAVTAVACFILEYTWPGRWLTRRSLVLLSIAPLLALGLILTNDLHHLAWTGFTFDGSITPQIGPSNWFFLAYAYGLGLLEIAVFFWLFLHSPQHRWPVVILLTGQVISHTIYALDITNILPSDLPIDVLAIAFVFLMYAIALFGFRILDPVTLASQTAIAQMQDGMLVLDPQGRVVSLNPAAEWILRVPASRARGRPIQGLLPAYPNSASAKFDEISFSLPEGRPLDKAPRASHDGAATGQAMRCYTLSISLLKDWRGLEAGRLLLLRDVTEQKLVQAQTLEQQRALAILHEREQLARELHDSLGQVFAFVNAQGQTISRLLSRGDVSTADEYIRRLVEVARQADVDIRESILGLRVTLSGQRLIPALAQYLERYEKNYGIRAELELPKAFTDEVFEPFVEVQLLRILQEALTNIRKHASASCVRIVFTFEDGWAHVSVQDDGQGFDQGASPAEPEERVGLRVMRERAEEVGGHLSLHAEPGQGTMVVVQVPIKRKEKIGSEHA